MVKVWKTGKGLTRLSIVQERAASLNKPTQPDKVMESVQIMFEQAISRKATGTISTPRRALIPPLMGMNNVH